MCSSPAGLDGCLVSATVLPASGGEGLPIPGAVLARSRVPLWYSLGLATKQVDQILSLCRQGGKDRVVPVPVKRVGPQADGLQGVAADLEAGGIAGRVEPRPHAEARGGRRGRDQVHNDRVAEEGLASPVLADEGEQAVFDLVPLARAGREMAHRDGQAEAVRQLLQLDLPQPQAGAVA